MMLRMEHEINRTKLEMIKPQFKNSVKNKSQQIVTYHKFNRFLLKWDTFFFFLNRAFKFKRSNI